jgi:sortase A
MQISSMKDTRHPTLLKRCLVCCRYALLILGFSALGYCAWAFGERAVYQDWAERQLRRETIESPQESYPVRLQTSDPVRPQIWKDERDPEPLARIDIPRLAVSAMVAEGDGPRVLKLAVGHVPDTALPGEVGNVALAGHRDTFFRRLGSLKTGDLITLTTLRGKYSYVVRFTDVVGPDATWVLDPSPGQTLTLITCYPFHFLGAAPRRFIVRARRRDNPGAVESNTRLARRRQAYLQDGWGL